MIIQKFADSVGAPRSMKMGTSFAVPLWCLNPRRAPIGKSATPRDLSLRVVWHLPSRYPKVVRLPLR